MRRPYSQKVENQQLVVQELVVRTVDTQLQVPNQSGHTIVVIGEQIAAVYCVLDVVNANPDTQTVPASDISIVNSSDYGPTGTSLGASTYGRDMYGNPLPAPAMPPLASPSSGYQDAILLAGVTLATNDALIVKYSTLD